MGESKRKQTARPVLGLEDRNRRLGNDPFKAAYDLIYKVVAGVYTETGGVNHELIGIDFDSGKPTGVNVVLIKRVGDVPSLRDQMLLMWPMVVHVCEAWSAPDASCPPHDHPKRQDVVAITLHTIEFAATASCLVDEKEQSIRRGELVMPTEMGGRLGRPIVQRPLSS
jgi:hypothetical protein